MSATNPPETTTTSDGTHTGARFERPGDAPIAAQPRRGGTATAPIVLGSIGIVAGIFIPIAGLILGIIGLVLGLRAANGRAGVIVSSIAIAVSVASWIIAAAIIASS
jgi:hypothetical protein